VGGYRKNLGQGITKSPFGAVAGFWILTKITEEYKVLALAAWGKRDDRKVSRSLALFHGSQQYFGVFEAFFVHPPP
jgi:hypothetical protein